MSRCGAERPSQKGRNRLTLEVKILVGTMTGTAEMVAEEMNDVLEEAGHTPEVIAMDDLDATAFDQGKIFLIVTSTYGQGDVPDNAMAFYNALCAEKPDLSGKLYGVYSLGDRTYAETFNMGGLKFDKILTDCGASRIGDVFTHDASSGSLPEEDGIDWVKQWLTKVPERNAA